jgi:hypothetical protein
MRLFAADSVEEAACPLGPKCDAQTLRPDGNDASGARTVRGSRDGADYDDGGGGGGWRSNDGREGGGDGGDMGGSSDSGDVEQLAGWVGLPLPYHLTNLQPFHERLTAPVQEGGRSTNGECATFACAVSDGVTPLASGGWAEAKPCCGQRGHGERGCACAFEGREVVDARRWWMTRVCGSSETETSDLVWSSCDLGRVLRAFSFSATTPMNHQSAGRIKALSFTPSLTDSQRRLVCTIAELLHLDYNVASDRSTIIFQFCESCRAQQEFTQSQPFASPSESSLDAPVGASQRPRPYFHDRRKLFMFASTRSFWDSERLQR